MRRIVARVFTLLLVGTVLVSGIVRSSAAEQVLIPKGAEWKYLDDGSDQTPFGLGTVDQFGLLNILSFFGLPDLEQASVKDVIEQSFLLQFLNILSPNDAVQTAQLILNAFRNQSAGAIIGQMLASMDESFPPPGGLFSYSEIWEQSGAKEIADGLTLGQLMDEAGVSDRDLFKALEDAGVFDALDGINPADLLLEPPVGDVLDQISLKLIFSQFPSWRKADFDDSAWKTGNAQFGYGDGDEQTVVESGGTPKFITTYFRKKFNVADLSGISSLWIRILRDDGAVVYLNGTEVARSNMPTGRIQSDTTASSGVDGADEQRFFRISIPRELLLQGENILAVEIHQSSQTSSDISFDLEMIGSDVPGLTRGPYLQMGSPSSMVVRWRTDSPTVGVVRYGLDSANLASAVTNATPAIEHEVMVTGLQPNTKYFYSIGVPSGALLAGDDLSFTTAIPAGQDAPIRIWAIGDAGTADTNAAAVYNSYLNYAAGRRTDVWLMLGDNAYQNGTDAQYQKAVFEMYPTFLKQNVAWSTLGNHETDQATQNTFDYPFYTIFSNPTNAEAGGLASGTESYYSFNYANAHFVCLNSMTEDRATNAPMATWLINDLRQNTQDWTIVYFHHPPYTKGSHDSDSEVELQEMRENILPILEEYDVDLVLSGHSHVYERSYLLDGHYGNSSTFTAAMKKDAGSGRITETGAYKKGGPAGTAHDGTVYIVAGSSGQTTSTSGSTYYGLNHPAMFVSLNKLNSMVIEIQGNRLEGKGLGINGLLNDNFTLLKNTTANKAPTVTLVSPDTASRYGSGQDLVLEAQASDSDGVVNRVGFFDGTQLLGTVSAAPYRLTLTNVDEGHYEFKAVAIDELEARTESAVVPIDVAPQIQSVTKFDDRIEIRFTAKAGERYIVEMSPTVDQGPWQPLTQFGPEPQRTTVLIEYVISGVQKYFRLTKPPQPVPPQPGQ